MCECLFDAFSSKMDPVGECDGERFDYDKGEHVRHFATRQNYGTFVSVANVVKITPSNILSTLTDAIQKLNKHIVCLSHKTLYHVQQIAKQKQQIQLLTAKMKKTQKMAARRLETINNLKKVSILSKSL